MPLNPPPLGSVPLYARNRVSGETYLVAGAPNEVTIAPGPNPPPDEPELWLNTTAIGTVDSARDTGFVANPPWAPKDFTKPPGAFKHGLTVTIHGTVMNPGLTIAPYSVHHVGTVSAEFQPTADFLFPIVWYDTESHGPISTYGYIRPDGEIWVRTSGHATWELGATDWVTFNATYTLD